LTRILVIDKGMTDAGRGAVVQRLLDIETYRTLAALGLALARSLSPEMRRIEDGLTKITQGMKAGARENADSSAFRHHGALASELEANAALSLYRFGASRAYYNIVRERIASLNETGQPGFETIGAFLEKRLAPAMRTCQSIEERQANLSRKLSRATALLRSWIDVELERQNSALLSSMNRRVKLQLRMQQTVEGLSVAAISYYIVGLFGYLAKPLDGLGLPIKPGLSVCGLRADRHRLYLDGRHDPSARGTTRKTSPAIATSLPRASFKDIPTGCRAFQQAVGYSCHGFLLCWTESPVCTEKAALFPGRPGLLEPVVDQKSIPDGIAGAAASFFGFSAIMASVVTSRPATEAAS
jgi:hypothetical protein